MILIFALSVLGAVTAPMLALLSASLFEPLIARNQADAVQALYSAEAGLEWAFTLLVNTADWDTVAPASGTSDPAAASPVPPQPTAASALLPPDGLLPAGLPTITALRGVPSGSRPLSGEDAGVITLTSTATVNGAHRTVEAVVRRLSPRAQGIFERHALVAWRER